MKDGIREEVGRATLSDSFTGPLKDQTAECRPKHLLDQHLGRAIRNELVDRPGVVHRPIAEVVAPPSNSGPSTRR